MKNRLIAGAFVLSLLALSGCSSADQSSPESVANSYYQAIASADYKTACQLLIPSLAEVLGSSCENSIKDVETTGDMAGVDFSQIQFGAPEVNGDSAVIQATVGEINFPVRTEKIDGVWYLNPAH